MNVFDQIIAKIGKPAGMTRSTPEEIAKMRQEYPSVPDVYFEFMAAVGWGDIGGMMIFSGLSELRAPDGWLADQGFPDAKIVLFGDTWCGDGHGFDLDRGAQLVAIFEGELWDEDDSFIELLEGYAN